MKIGAVILAAALGAAIAIAVILYLNKEDADRIENMEKEVKVFRKETSDNFDTLRAEVLKNRGRIDTVAANTDTLKAGQVVIYNAVMSYDKNRPVSETPYEFITKIKRFFGIGDGD